MTPKPPDYFVPPWRWGIFHRRSCSSLNLDSSETDFEAMSAIYKVLKDMGFKETYWQFVYPGQIGGLVKNPRNNFLELHIRFFENAMIYAEIEMGRSVLLHFLNRRLYLNNYITKKIYRKLSSDHYEYLLKAIEKYKIKNDKDWSEWGLLNKFVTHGMRQQIRLFSFFSDWRTLSAIMLASIAASLVKEPVLIPLLVATMIFIYLLAPRRN